MKIKVALLDFDGTLVEKDILDLLCKSIGKEKESEELNKAFHRGELPGLKALIGSKPQMDGVTIMGIDESAFSSKSFKTDGIRTILKGLNVTSENIIALGDSPSDKGMFELSSYAIAVNPKGDIASSADVVIGADLNEAVKLLTLA